MSVAIHKPIICPYCLPARSADQNNIRIGSEFQQIVLQKQQSPCRHLLHAVPAEDIRALACHRDKAVS